MTALKTPGDLSRELGETFDNFDTQMQKLTTNLDPDNVRVAGAMALEIGMYANSLAKILNDLIGIVAQLSETDVTPE